MKLEQLSLLIKGYGSTESREQSLEDDLGAKKPFCIPG